VISKNWVSAGDVHSWTCILLTTFYLASSEDTAGFAKIYQNGLVDEEMIETRPLDLKHEFNTNYNPEDEDIAMSDGQEYEREDREEGSEAESEDEEDVNKNRSFISYREIQQEVRRIREQPQVRCSAETDCHTDVYFKCHRR